MIHKAITSFKPAVLGILAGVGLILGALCGTWTLAQDWGGESWLEEETEDAEESGGQQGQYLLGQTEMKRGESLFQQQEYKRAIKHFDVAIKHFRKAGDNEDLRQRIAVAEKSKGRAYASWAERLAAEGQETGEASKFDTAIGKLRQAIQLNPDKEQQYRQQIKAYLEAEENEKLKVTADGKTVEDAVEEAEEEDQVEAEDGRDAESDDEGDVIATETGVKVEGLLPEELSIEERVRREEQYLLGQTEMRRGRNLYQQQEYKRAIEHFNLAIKHFRNAGNTKTLRQRVSVAEESKSRAYAGWAEKLAAEGKEMAETSKFETAMEKLRQAIQLNPEKGEQYRQQIKSYLEAEKQAKLEEETAEKNVLPDKEESEREITKLIEQGRLNLENGRLSAAGDKFEEVLVIDPYNVHAIRYLRKVNEQLSKWAEERRKMIRKEKLAEVKWEWSPPVRAIGGERDGEGYGKPVAKMGNTELQQKLDEIVFPELEFEEATIHQVVVYLRSKSKELDPEGTGVNILLNVTAEQRTEPAPAEPADGGGGDFDEGFDDWPEEDTGAPAETGGGQDAGQPAAGSRTITLQMSNIALNEAIKYVCQVANLDYVVEKNAVIIGASGALRGREMETEFYPIPIGTFKTERTAEAADIGEWGTEDAETGDEESDSLTSAKIKEYFRNLGVRFPEGSSVAYDQRTSKLIVHNTEQHLRTIERLLRELNITPTQVMIEAKFVEINQEDLEGLGMQWRMLDGVGSQDADFQIKPEGFAGASVSEVYPTDFKTYTTWGVDSDGDAYPITEFLTDEQGDRIPTGYDVVTRDVAGVFDSSLSSGVRTVSNALSAGGNSGVLGMSMVLGAMELSSLIHAIDQT
ncbi:MAG: hypothetical protein R6V56_00970, partial [Lentisphaeria bacterium]